MEYFFDTREDASVAAAKRLVGNLSKRLEHQPAASLVVSGGTTPTRCFRELAGTDIDWSRVHVLLSDERWVPSTDDSSNEKLVRETLLREHASAAKLWPTYDGDVDILGRCEAMDEIIRTLPIPFASALLGMGEDGHFASLFPDADNLEQGLGVDSDHLCIPVKTAASPHPRISLTLSAISRSDEVILLIFGDKKREVLEQAKASGNTYPIAHLIKQKRAPVRVFWAP
jgi:6-phosphogluconolactonase